MRTILAAKSVFPRRRTFRLYHLVEWLVALTAFLLACPGAARAADASATGRISNFSARAVAGTGGQTLTVGFIVSGNGNSFLLRGIGPALGSYGVANALADPRLSLFSGSAALVANDNWGGAFIAPAVGAFPLSTGSLDAAILAALDAGVYTTQVGTNGGSGVALAEIYDTQTTSARLMNLSARAQVGTGEAALLSGFTIAGTAPRTVMLRAIGPGLAAFGVTGTLADPKLELFEAGVPAPFAVNDNWGGSAQVKTAVGQAGAFPLATDAKDAAMLLTLPPGTYTAKVSGAGTSTGVALLELYDQPISLYPLTSANNVVYQHGDVIKFSANGGYVHADGSKTLVTDGWLRLEIFDEGLRNPLNHNLPVLSLVETQLYVGALVAPNGASMPVRIVGFPTTRYYVQDQYGTILYQGERVPEGTDSTGAPLYHTYWFSSPLDYIQYQAPFVIGASKTTPYTKQGADTPLKKLGNTVTTVEAIETATVPLGNFSTYRVRLLETSNDPATLGTPLWYRTQNISPDIGIVRFDFFSVTPGDTGAITMGLCETNLPYLGGSNFTLATGDVLKPSAVGQYTRFARSGFYIANDGTIEELSGWFTMEVKDEGVVDPVINQKVLTLLETHDTQIEATTLAGVVTHTSTRQAFRRYAMVNAAGETAFVGDSLPDGTPVWFENGFVPLHFPYAIGQTSSQTIKASRWVNGQAVAAYTYTPSMAVISKVPVRTRLGTFECYRMTYSDTNGYRAEQYTYPAVGVTRFTYPAPAGKMGHMDLTLSSTNVSFQ